MPAAADLPRVDDAQAEEAICADEELLHPVVRALLRRLGVDPDGLARFPAGSLPVYAAGDLVIKLFPPSARADCAIEAGVLTAVQGQLPVATPRVRDVGERNGWGYLLMSRLEGQPLDQVWSRSTDADRDRLAGQVGEAIRALHALPAPLLLPGDWPAFVAAQRAACVPYQLGLGLAPEWLDQIPEFLARVTLPSPPPVLLHTEVMRQHLFVGQDAGRWRLTGLLDFEPATCGAPEYEFVAVGCFVSEGDARFLRRTLTAYGYHPDDLDRDLRRRLLAWGLLHRYSNLAAWLRRLPPPERPTLDAVADRWFAVD